MSVYITNSSHLIKEAHIELYEPNSTAAIFLSGGLDSAVLLYALLLEREKTKKNIHFTALTVSKVAAELYSQSIVNCLQKRFGQLQHVTGVDNEGSAPGAITEAIRKKLRLHEFDTVYTGINRNPPAELFTPKGGLSPVRPTRSPHDTLKLPFLDLYKSHIINLGAQLKIHDLMALTHSCTEQVEGRCSVCFACDERDWGFRENQILDPGNL